ncbi:DUF5610 domain-containing protein [uncultured Paraglaciecola sp.]|uniref:DUF5610 domain-containing protein n=1 Tax=uncultured Paraglaciecola sp. TaxID=1765024 RepID=UPI0026356BEC|nr:DUF5610 domain-containing protein [uncultured Paraglaciecola sp.]
MNISQLKAFLGNKPQHIGDDSIKNQLRDAGLKQAITGLNSHALQRVDQFSSSASLGMHIYSNALNNTLEVDRKRPDFSAPESNESEASLFDFEEIAKNVLTFVGGAIKNAHSRGADVGELNDLFEQASSGVLKGIKLAEKDLGGFLNDEIAEGISKSKHLIEEGIANLKHDILNSETVGIENTASSVVNSTSVSYAKQQTGELNIRTRDGDSVNIRFEDLREFELNQHQIYEAVQQPEDKEVATKKPVEQTIASTTESESPLSEIETELEPGDEVDSIEEPLEPIPLAVQRNAVFYQESSLSFSVNGELDDDELKAIGQLVSDSNALAEEFFNGDIETAFNQALELGFDEQELSSFALQLTKAENTEVIKAYETVSHFDEDGVDNDPAKAVKPVAEYLDKLLNVLEGSKRRLADTQSYENVINELINKLGDEVATPDLISAIHRFNEFNQKLINNLPIGYQPEQQS